MNGSPSSVTVGKRGKKFHFLEPLHVCVDGEVDSRDQGAVPQGWELVGRSGGALVGLVRVLVLVLVSGILVQLVGGVPEVLLQVGQVVEGSEGNGGQQETTGNPGEVGVVDWHVALCVILLLYT